MVTKVGDDMLQTPGGLPMTTKGDLAVHNGSANVRLPVGSDGQALIADSAQAEGVKWGAVARYIGEISLGAQSATPSGWLPCDGAAVSRSTYSDLFSALGTTYGPGDGSTTFNVPDLRGRLPMGDGTGSSAFDISAVNTTSEEITVPSNDALHIGQAVVYTTSGTPIGGLSNGVTYYVIRVDATKVQLASSRVNAVAGTEIDLTSAGSGTQLLTLTLTARAMGEFGGEEEHSLTEAEMPLHTHAGSASVALQGTGADASADFSANTGPAGSSEDHNNLPPYTVFKAFVYSGV